MQEQLTLGLCECGCGQPTRLAYRSDTARGWRRGEPMRFVNGHAARLTRKPYETQFEVGQPDECWVWQGAADKDGYGLVQHGGKLRRAHRIALEQKQGYLTPGMLACHTCDNPPCVNPAHLFEGTNTDNMRDMVAKGRANFVGAPCKISPAQVAEIRSRYAAGEATQQDLGAEYGVSQSLISLIVRNKLR